MDQTKMALEIKNNLKDVSSELENIKRKFQDIQNNMSISTRSIFYSSIKVSNSNLSLANKEITQGQMNQVLDDIFNLGKDVEQANSLVCEELNHVQKLQEKLDLYKDARDINLDEFLETYRMIGERLNQILRIVLLLNKKQGGLQIEIQTLGENINHINKAKKRKANSIFKDIHRYK